jgi:hypothetical protein
MVARWLAVAKPAWRRLEDRSNATAALWGRRSLKQSRALERRGLGYIGYSGCIGNVSPVK